MTKPELFHFMAAESYGVVGSIAPDGSPQSALVGIAVTPELEIVFDTLKSTRKYANLVANPAASFVIGTTREVTVQFDGIATQLSGEDTAHYQQIYFAKWPDGPSRLAWPGLVHFVVRPRWIRYSDFDARPPKIVEFTF
jgi:hypothetical protein